MPNHSKSTGFHRFKKRFDHILHLKGDYLVVVSHTKL